jgi:hypothetical protein
MDGRTEDRPVSKGHRPLNGYGAKNDQPPTHLHKGKGGLLTNDKEVEKDVRLIERAIRERWDIRKKGMIQRRLLDVMAKTSVQVLTKAGIFDSEADADTNAIAASRVLVQMNGQDQADDHKESDSGKPLGVQVNVVNNLEPGQSRILQLAKSLGARELIIDDQSIRLTESIGESKEAGIIQPTAGKSVVSNATLAQARAIFES